MTVKILIGDCREKLRELPDGSVHCCVTSPPYFNLRDYGVAGQMGLEPTPDEFVAALVLAFREVRRVLRDDGTLWLNIGDTYANDAKWGGTTGGKHVKGLHGSNGPSRRKVSTGLKAKDLIGIPWMLVFALRADGWHLRQDIIWSKPNPMPEPVTDRCTKAHEYLFLLSKGPRYHYAGEAIAEAAQPRIGGSGNKARKQRPGAPESHTGQQAGSVPWTGTKRNKGSVWTVAAQPFGEAHFATFPPALIEPCILAGCPKGGTVLDPFGGAGTTGLVADRLGRSAVLIELNPDYAALAEARIGGDKGGLLAAMET